MDMLESPLGTVRDACFVTAGQLNAQGDNRTGAARRSCRNSGPGLRLLRAFRRSRRRLARVLVLGSMPSVASLAKQEYYGHPRNAFWPIMGRLFGAGPELPYDQRKAVLCERGVAVWDVLKTCRRAGSLDTSIRVDSETPNDFVTFFRAHPADWRRVLQRPESGDGLSPTRAIAP